MDFDRVAVGSVGLVGLVNLVTWHFQVERFVACGPEATAQTHTPPITTCVFGDERCMFGLKLGMPRTRRARRLFSFSESCATMKKSFKFKEFRRRNLHRLVLLKCLNKQIRCILVLAVSCSQPHLKARECTVLANTLHKAARLQQLWLSKMFDQGLLQQSRKDAQRMLSKLPKFKAEDSEDIRRKHDFLFPHLFHCFHGRVALDSHAHLLTITSALRNL